MMVALKINAMLSGGTGVRKSLVQAAIKVFNAGIVPAVPLSGSEAGRTAAAMAPLGGAGRGLVRGEPVTATPELFKAAGCKPVSLAAKEALALTSGTAPTTAYAVLAATKLAVLVGQSAVVSTVSWAVLGGPIQPFDELVHMGRPHKGQRQIADVLRTFALPEMWHSEAYAAARAARSDAADAAGGSPAACLAEIPQVYGAVADAAKAAMKTLGVEINACGDSPMMLESGSLAVTGNSNKAYPALAAQSLVAAASELVASIVARAGAVGADADDLAQLETSAAAAVGASDAALGAFAIAKVAEEAAATEYAAAAAGVAAAAPLAFADPVSAVVAVLEKAEVSAAAAALASGAVASAADPFLMRGPGVDPNAGKAKGRNKARRVPKIPKGTRDFGPLDMSVRREVFAEVENVYRAHGAVAIDTPTFELRETLMGRYGEDTKLIYDLADQGGEDLSLRYDLTVPFARYVASAGISKIKRYHIGRVFRRDNPAIARGRFREFYQCDFDIAGPGYEAMVPDAECVLILAEILERLDIGDFVIKINHRKLLDGIFAVCGVPESKFRSTCSAVDKLDKMPWADVATELVEIKGLPADVVERLEKFVMLGDETAAFEPTLEALEALDELQGKELAAGALADMRKFADMVCGMGIDTRISFCTSLARGLDYYTGIIVEAILIDSETSLGSIAGGGRYDDLIGMFGSKPVPSVGFSVGIERVFALVKARKEAEGSARAIATQALIVGLGSATPGDRLRLAKTMWDAGIPAEISYSRRTNFKTQLEYALDNRIPFMLIIGDEELERGVVQVKSATADQDSATQVEVTRDDLVAHMTAALAQL